MTFDKLNKEKTEVIILSNKSRIFHIDLDLNHVICDGEGNSLPSSNVARNLGVYFDSNLTIESHIKKVTQSCHF